MAHRLETIAKKLKARAVTLDPYMDNTTVHPMVRAAVNRTYGSR